MTVYNPTKNNNFTGNTGMSAAQKYRQKFIYSFDNPEKNHILKL